MRLNVKANQVGAQQPVNEFTLPWANPEDFGVWPGDMPENRDAGVWANFLNHARNQCQVIVLRQENRRIHVRHFLQNSIGKPLVNPLVLQPVLGSKNRPGVRDVAERPKALVRKTIVVAFFFFVGEPDAAQCVTGAIGRNAEPVAGIDNFSVSAARAVRNPCAVACQQNGFEGRDHAAGRHDHFDRFVLPVEHMHVRLAIRNDKERLLLESIAQADAQPFRCP